MHHLFKSIILLLLVVPPSGLYAIGMGGMQGLVDELSIQTKNVGAVSFSHSLHSSMTCNMCHPKIFQKKRSNSLITMKAMQKGQSCGACHNGKIVFSVTGSCATCHAGDLEFETKSVGKVPFSHDVHSEMFGCDECHPDLYQAKRGANKPATMAEMEAGDSCGACHDGATAFGVAEDCTSCHAGDIVYKDETAGNIVFPHAAHIEMFGCDECHPDLYQAKRGANKPATMAEMEAGDSCGTCHDGATAFGVAEDCTSCHAGDIVYKDENAGNVVFPHAAHIEMFGCDECHPDLYQAKRGANKPATMADMEGGASCGACHDGATAFGVAEDCEACHAM